MLIFGSVDSSRVQTVANQRDAENWEILGSVDSGTVESCEVHEWLDLSG